MKKVLLATAFVVMSGSAWAEKVTCPESTETFKCWPCGANCILTLDTVSGHAIIDGTGEMDPGRLSDGKNEWSAYGRYFKTAEIKQGITSVGDGAFHSTNVETVSIPNSVTRIGSQAFDGAGALKALTIPDSVISIGDWAFDSTRSLKELVIPDSVREIGYAAFFSSAGIQKLTIPDHLTFAARTSLVQDPRPYAGSTFGGATNIICAGGGDTAKCDALLAQTGKNIQSTSRPNYRLDENGNIVERYQYDEEGNLVSYTKSNADGSVYTYDADGNVKSIRGKKIYTVEEAEAVTAHGDRFHVSLTYK